MSQITSWISDKTLRDCSTFEPPSDTSILKSYFLDIKNAPSGDYYLSVWNSVPTTEQNSFAAISETSRIDQAVENMKFRNFGKGFIPGFATYFWVSPSKNQLATVRFERSYNGHQSFKYLINGFLKNNPTYAAYSRNVEKGEVLIQGFTANDENPTLCFPYFQTTGIKKKGPIDFIKKNVHRITKIHGQSIIIPGARKSLSFYNTLLKFIGSSNTAEPTTDYKVFYEFPCTLNIEDFNSIYEKWSTEESDLLDVGFVIGKDVYWLSKEIQKTEINLDIQRLNGELYDLNSIMEKIETSKEQILDDCKK